MGNHYNQLSFKDRVQLQTLSELGLSARKIATKMGRSNKTVASELKRCLKDQYCAEKAHFKAVQTNNTSDSFKWMRTARKHR